MNDIESLLRTAGYQFNSQTGRYLTIDAGENDVDYATEDVADELKISIENLMRWEQAQTAD